MKTVLSENVMDLFWSGLVGLVALVLWSFWTGLDVVQHSTAWGCDYGHPPPRINDLLDFALGLLVLKSVAENGVDWILRSMAVVITLECVLRIIAGNGGWRGLVSLSNMLDPKHLLAIGFGIAPPIMLFAWLLAVFGWQFQWMEFGEPLECVWVLCSPLGLACFVVSAIIVPALMDISSLAIWSKDVKLPWERDVRTSH
jgi:hypothetical protein